MVAIPKTTRRALAAGLALGTAALLPSFSLEALAQSADTAALMQPGPLGDVWLGPADVKVTIIEYASMTCSHCAHFHATTWPVLKGGRPVAAYSWPPSPLRSGQG